MNLAAPPDLIRAILERCGDDMANQRFQDPVIRVRADVERPFYWIRPYVPVFTSAGLERKQKSIPLGFCDEMTMREAKARKGQIMASINDGKFLLQSQVPFADVAAKFREIRFPQLGTAARRKYESLIATHVLPAFGRSRMCEIDRAAVEAWLSIKAEAGLSHWTLLDLRNVLSAIFSKAQEWKLWGGDNPCLNVKAAGVRAVRVKKIPKADALIRFLDSLHDTRICSAAAARLMVLTAVTAGLRVSEVLALQPGDIDRVARTVEVRRRWHRGEIAEPKTAASRRVRKIGGLADELAAFCAGRGEEAFVFGRADREGAPPDDRDLQQHVFRPAAEAAGIYHPGFGMHSFRRLNISWRQEVGATPFEAMKGAGHAQPGTTWMYTVTDDEREERHVDAIWERLSLAGMKAKGGVQ